MSTFTTYLNVLQHYAEESTLVTLLFSHCRYLRLELLEGVVAYHSGQVDKSRKVLTSAQEKFTQVITRLITRQCT